MKIKVHVTTKHKFRIADTPSSPKDSAEELAERSRLIAEFLKTHKVKKLASAIAPSY